MTVQFLNGWMQRFKKRHGLRFRRAHGDGNSADAKAIRDQMPRIWDLLSSFAECDVWNAEEFGLFYRQPASRTLASEPVAGFKKKTASRSLLPVI